MTFKQSTFSDITVMLLVLFTTRRELNVVAHWPYQVLIYMPETCWTTCETLFSLLRHSAMKEVTFVRFKIYDIQMLWWKHCTMCMCTQCDILFATQCVANSTRHRILVISVKLYSYCNFQLCNTVHRICSVFQVLKTTVKSL